MRKNIVMRMTCLLPVLLLGACRYSDPDDLRFESIDTGRLSDFPGAWAAVQLQKSVKSNAIVLLKINFTTQYDLIKLAKANTVHISPRAFACDGGNLQGYPLFVLPDLRIGNFSAGSGVYSAVPNLERYRDQSGRLTYHVLVPIAGEELKRLFGSGTVPGEIPYFNPHGFRSDICLQLTAAAMWFGPTLHSNVVRVPVQEISRLINLG